VERWSRYVLLVKVDSKRTDEMVAALTQQILTLPLQAS